MNKKGKLPTMTIGERITELREKQNITKAELSRKAGLKQPMITNYEAGTSDPSATVVVKLAEALNTSTDYLLTGMKNMNTIEENMAQLNEGDRRQLITWIESQIELYEIKRKYNSMSENLKEYLPKQ